MRIINRRTPPIKVNYGDEIYRLNNTLTESFHDSPLESDYPNKVLMVNVVPNIKTKSKKLLYTIHH